MSTTPTSPNSIPPASPLPAHPAGKLSLVLKAAWNAGRLIYQASPRWTVLWALTLVLQGLVPVGIVYLTRPLVDSLLQALPNLQGLQGSRSWVALQPTLVLAAAMAGLMLAAEVLQSGVEWIRTAQSEHLQDHILSQIHAKAITLDLAFFENPQYHDRLHRAASEAATRPLGLLENAGGLVQNGLTLAGILALLIPYGAWLPAALLVSAAPVLWVVMRYNRRYHRWWEQTTAARRMAQYYEAMLTHREAAAEVRLFDLGAYFQDSYRNLRARLRQERLGLLRSQSLARLAAGGFALLVTGAVLIWQLAVAWQGALTAGDLALFYQAFSRGQTLLRAALSNLGQIYTNALFLSNLFDFFDLIPLITEPASPRAAPAPVQQGIRFSNIAFRYPGSTRQALSDFHLELPAGQITAIVGSNGAGKSTLVKLLCRFYDPDQGRIEIDGVDLKDIPLAELRRNISVLFQAPIPYHTTVAENIGLGDLPAARDAAAAARIREAAAAAGAEEIIERLPQGFDTLLGRWFAEGEELSAGEWQRIALARAYFRQSPIVILDEPTSFMDSWAEAEWYDQFRELVNGRTALMITHRFTIAMRADWIYVLQEGRVVESGSHNDLLAAGGLYARSWSDQMQAASHLAA